MEDNNTLVYDPQSGIVFGEIFYFLRKKKKKRESLIKLRKRDSGHGWWFVVLCWGWMVVGLCSFSFDSLINQEFNICAKPSL
ncbi:hypothetical protein ACOSQ3_030517 [Xanthoceras sorbifolium]